MLRRLLLLLILFAVGWFLRRGLSGLRGQARRPAEVAPEDGSAVPGRMVRDRICNTFLPEDRALREQRGDESHFFCSERCRQAFVSRA